MAAKDEGDLPGLSFLNTARGVNPIVRKLPFNLQEKWVSVGASYKRKYCVAYPPFACFVDFVSQEASIRNDPSFDFISHPDTAPRTEKMTVWKPNKHREVSVHKTEVFPRATSDTGEPPSKPPDDCDKLCLIHKKPHPLRKCRAFREKHIEDRKKRIMCALNAVLHHHTLQRTVKLKYNVLNAKVKNTTQHFTPDLHPGQKRRTLLQSTAGRGRKSVLKLMSPPNVLKSVAEIWQTDPAPKYVLYECIQQATETKQ